MNTRISIRPPFVVSARCLLIPKTVWLIASLLLLPSTLCAILFDRYDFDNLIVGQQYTSIITGNGAVKIDAVPFQNSNGDWISTGSIIADADLKAGGSFTELHLMEAGFVHTFWHSSFMFGDTGISFLYGYYGGNINLWVGQGFVNVPNPLSLDGLIVGGVEISVTSLDEHLGWITIDGPFDSWGVGGTDLYVDSLFRTDVPDSGHTGILLACGLFGIVLLSRARPYSVFRQ